GRPACPQVGVPGSHPTPARCLTWFPRSRSSIRRTEVTAAGQPFSPVGIRYQIQQVQEINMSELEARSSLAEPLKFAYWVPNVSGGLVTSTIEQRTEFSFDYNKKLAVLAENSGFDYALSQVRYASSYGAAQQHDPAAFSLG